MQRIFGETALRTSMYDADGNLALLDVAGDMNP
jgi:hypothetical protein